MATKKGPSEAETPVLPVAETPLPVEVEATPEEGAPEVAAQEKPDFRAQFTELPEEERKAFLEENAAEMVRRAEQSGRDSAYARLQADQQRQAQANQELQDTLRNLDTETDDNKRAGHIQAFVDRQAWLKTNKERLVDLENVREALGVSPREHDEIVFKLNQQIARENEEARQRGDFAFKVATFGDYVKAVTGERYVTKQEAGKLSRAEMDAYFEEKMGLKREGEPAPVSVGQGQPTRSTADDVANAQGQEAKRIAFEKRHGFKPL